MTLCCGADADKNLSMLKTANTVIRLISELRPRPGWVVTMSDLQFVQRLLPPLVTPALNALYYVPTVYTIIAFFAASLFGLLFKVRVSCKALLLV